MIAEYCICTVLYVLEWVLAHVCVDFSINGKALNFFQENTILKIIREAIKISLSDSKYEIMGRTNKIFVLKVKMQL